jgi:predicted transcriptional regulator
MTSLRSVLAFNMKAQRHILGIIQAQLAERVNTSTNYIVLIESDISEVVASRLRKFGSEVPQAFDPNADTDQKMG